MMSLHSATLSIKVIMTAICITFFAATLAKAEASQNENIVKLIKQMKENQNQHTQALAELFEADLKSKALVIDNDLSKFDDDSCGTIGFLGTTVPTLYLNFNDPECANQIVDTAIHEYEHIRILRDELFEKAVAAQKTGKTNASDVLDKKSIDYIVGFQSLNELKKGKLTLTPSVASQIMSFLQFKIYTETKAYLNSRMHIGHNVKDPWSDQKITSTIFTDYLERVIPYDDVHFLVSTAKGSLNYDDYLMKTAEFRSYDYSTRILKHYK